MSPIDSERARSRQRERAQTAQSQFSERTVTEREANRATDAGHERERCPECDGQLVVDHEHGE